jgi:hypothetical protein
VSIPTRSRDDIPTPVDLGLIKSVRESAQFQRDMSPDLQNQYLAYYILVDGLLQADRNLRAVTWLACEGNVGYPVLSFEDRQHLVSVIESSARVLVDLAAVIRDFIPTGDEHTRYL